MRDIPTIVRVTASEAGSAFALHIASLGEFMLPIGRDAFDELVAAGQLFALARRGALVGICYVKPDGKNLDEVPRWEYGGVHVSPDLRRTGLGTALSAVAVAAVSHDAPKPVMAYVHQANLEPLAMIVGRLGFVFTGKSIRLGPEQAPGYLRRDADGYATADVLELPPHAVGRLADGLELLDRRTVRLADDLFPTGLETAAENLRRTAYGSRASASEGRVVAGRSPGLS
ncbi:hypothetical protein Val02_36670 [Virgisporangium aliadipatigenens]|uniref:N-acetyltransferase domain-containing protein n=1 Tax=Virgisporangium aliadipatigenens TaxID=741659 RepID=A0A8J4DR76_9ACTN|nr:GNAT family N-acetyltransferase [Virgisporangium aliadipatigenens]GIJ46781.1 hypothetical protein Val02_36670 [Virgisporangium aliadipatigenens]